MTKQDNQNKPANFLQDAKGNYSSRRVAFIGSNIALISGLITTIILFKNDPQVIQEILSDFMIYSAVLGGTVSSDIFSNIFNSSTRANIKLKKKNAE
jgi:hypothetical protein